MHPYRVFVSYSREDKPLARRLVDRLASAELRAVWDEDIKPAQRFCEVIKHDIAHAHVFLPILTRKSVKRPWVHQETGYAMGLGVPVLPMAVGRLPGEMLRDLQAIQVRPDLRDLTGEKLGAAIADLLARDYDESEAMFRCAGLPEMRADLLSRYTQEAMSHGAFGRLQQAGAMSSFNLPRAPLSESIWIDRDRPFRRSELLRKLYLRERLALEAYAGKHGCDLIIDPSIPLKQYEPGARKLRLETLLEFLQDPKVKDVRVAVRTRGTARNLTIVGDWFSAESVTPRPGKGYYQTVFNWHAPTVLERTREFDRDFQQLLGKAGVTDESSRAAAIEAVQRVIDGIKA